MTKGEAVDLKTVANGLTEASDSAGLRRLAGHLALLAATGCLVAAALSAHWLMVLVAMVLHGVVLVFLFAPLHETIHRTAFRSTWLNDLVATVAGFLIALPPRGFRYFHFAHHRWTQDPERDPELATPKPATIADYTLVLTGWRYWAGQAQAIASQAAGARTPAYAPASARGMLQREALAYLIGYALVLAVSLYLGTAAALWFWVLPALLGQPFLRAFLLAEHTACPLTDDMLQNSRTTFTTRLAHWLTWEMSNHSAHHFHPQTPFHNLPELTARLRPHLSSTASGYAEAHRQIRGALGENLKTP